MLSAIVQSILVIDVIATLKDRNERIPEDLILEIIKSRITNNKNVEETSDKKERETSANYDVNQPSVESVEQCLNKVVDLEQIFKDVEEASDKKEREKSANYDINQPSVENVGEISEESREKGYNIKKIAFSLLFNAFNYLIPICFFTVSSYSSAHSYYRLQKKFMVGKSNKFWEENSDEFENAIRNSLSFVGDRINQFNDFSASRDKERFDKVGLDIEEKWGGIMRSLFSGDYKIVIGEDGRFKIDGKDAATKIADGFKELVYKGDKIKLKKAIEDIKNKLPEDLFKKLTEINSQSFLQVIKDATPKEMLVLIMSVVVSSYSVYSLIQAVKSSNNPTTTEQVNEDEVLHYSTQAKDSEIASAPYDTSASELEQNSKPISLEQSLDWYEHVNTTNF